MAFSPVSVGELEYKKSRFFSLANLVFPRAIMVLSGLNLVYSSAVLVVSREHYNNTSCLMIRGEKSNFLTFKSRIL